MSLLTPAFLAGLAALAVPLLVHLAYRSKGKPTPFPSLHFLDRIPFRTRRRRALRHPALFALRSAALVLLVLAFARPVLPGGAEPRAAGEAREVVLLLDRSYSMGYGDRWERAVAGLREAAAGLAPGDRGALVVFSDRAETRVTPTGDAAALLAALDGLAPGHGTTRYQAGFRAAGRLLAESERGRREVVVATDFQAAGWADRGPLVLPPGARVRAVDASDAEPANLGLSDLALVRHPAPSGADIAVRVSNVGREPAAGVEVRLEVNGRAVGTRRVDVPGRSAATVGFGGVALPDGGARGTLRLTAPDAADRLAADDALHFFAVSGDPLRARVVEQGRGAADRSLHLRRALAIGGEPPVAVERAAEPGTAGADAVDLVLLNDVDVTGEAAARALAGFVEGGGGLMVALGGRSDPSRWPEAARRLLPARVGEAVDRVREGGARLATVEYGHPVFAPFRGPRSGDLSTARFLRYRRVEPDTAARVLARFDDGRPALVEGTVGRGRVLLWASSLDRAWSDFPIQPVFLPFVQRLAVHAADWRSLPRFRTVGESLDVAALLEERGAATGAGEEWIVASPGGDRVPVRTGEGDALVLLDEPGFWEVRRLDGRGAAIPVAVNPDPAESDLATLDPEELLAAAGTGTALADGGAAGAAAAADPAGGPGGGSGDDDASPGREAWWPLLAAAAALFLAEGVLARRLDGRGRIASALRGAPARGDGGPRGSVGR